MEMGREYYTDVRFPLESDAEGPVWPCEDDAIVASFRGRSGEVVAKLLGKIVILPKGFSYIGNVYIASLTDKGNVVIAKEAKPAKLVDVYGANTLEFQGIKEEILRTRHGYRISGFSGGQFCLFVRGGALPDQYNVYDLS